MKQKIVEWFCLSLVSLMLTSGVLAEEVSTTDRMAQQADQVVSQGMEKAKELGDQAKVKIDELATSVEQSEKAKEISAGLLEPIYQLAEAMSFSAFHWVAFALMLAGVVSYALQLVLAKLVVLSKAGFSLSEVISDAVGLAISLVGLVLTTQAATENSTFTQSPAAVLSSAVVGILFGILLYRWGQAQEVEALKGRSESSD